MACPAPRDELGLTPGTGGSTHDALVALAAREHGATLATRDARTLPTYQALGATVEIVG